MSARPPAEAPSDEELLRRYQAADFAAFDLLYRRHERLVLGFLRAKLRDGADAEEAFQETFLKLHRSIARYDPAQGALGWILTIARNAAIDVARRKQVRRGVRVDADTVGEAPRQIAALEARAELAALTAGLSAAERALLERRLVDEESYEELAGELGLSEVNVRQRLSRLVRRLRRG
jgi:RNA polymerase sigma-70 factor (ECF subfamily)